MDTAADLTLQIVCYLQAGLDAPSSATQWALVPGPGRTSDTYADVAARLASIEKPIIVGALIHPGMIGVWRCSAMDASEWPRIRAALANQLTSLDAVT